MGIRGDITVVDWDSSPRIIEVAAPSVWATPASSSTLFSGRMFMTQ